MTQQTARWNAMVLAVVGVLCIGVSELPTSPSALAGGALVLAAGALVLVARRLPSRDEDPVALDDDEDDHWRSLAESEGTVTAVKRLRQAHPTLGLAEAVHLVKGDTDTTGS